MASAQARPKLRVWLFKSFVTAGNDVLAKHVEAWAKERNVDVELDWATFGDREQKFVAAIEAGNPPDLAEMNVLRARCGTGRRSATSEGRRRHRRDARRAPAVRRATR